MPPRPRRGAPPPDEGTPQVSEDPAGQPAATVSASVETLPDNYRIATEPLGCAICYGTINPGETYVLGAERGPTHEEPCSHRIQ